MSACAVLFCICLLALATAMSSRPHKCIIQHAPLGQVVPSNIIAAMCCRYIFYVPAGAGDLSEHEGDGGSKPDLRDMSVDPGRQHETATNVPALQCAVSIRLQALATSPNASTSYSILPLFVCFPANAPGL